jgi:hypothetical protein
MCSALHKRYFPVIRLSWVSVNPFLGLERHSLLSSVKGDIFINFLRKISMQDLYSIIDQPVSFDLIERDVT